MCKRILVVDDEASWVANLRRPLERAGFVVVAAGSAMEALAVLASAQIDGIVLDWELPDIEGVPGVQALLRHDPEIGKLALAAVVKANHPTVPVVLVSAYGTDVLVESAWRREVVARYVSKKNKEFRYELVKAVEDAVCGAEFRYDGTAWHFRYREIKGWAQDIVGLRYFQDLLIQEGTPILVSKLVRRSGEEVQAGADDDSGTPLPRRTPSRDEDVRVGYELACLEKDRISVYNAMQRAYSALRHAIAPLEAYLRPPRIQYREFYYTFVPDVCGPIKWHF